VLTVLRDADEAVLEAERVGAEVRLVRYELLYRIVRAKIALALREGPIEYDDLVCVANLDGIMVEPLDQVRGLWRGRGLVMVVGRMVMMMVVMMTLTITTTMRIMFSTMMEKMVMTSATTTATM
jgi:hypothetical protein